MVLLFVRILRICEDVLPGFSIVLTQFPEDLLSGVDKRSGLDRLILFRYGAVFDATKSVEQLSVTVFQRFLSRRKRFHIEKVMNPSSLLFFEQNNDLRILTIVLPCF